jgi:hypothetical protein
MNNSLNYFAQVEKRFQERRGAILSLSASDWALIESWRNAGIPIFAALRGIDAAFDKYEASRRRGRINGLAWCAPAVIQAADELRRASIGTAHVGDPERKTGFESTRVAAHLESAADALGSAAIAREACAANASQLRELAAKIRTPSGENADLETLDRSLSTLEEDLFSVLIASAPEDLKARWKEHAAHELMPYHSRITASQMQRLEGQFVQKQLLAHYGLPRVSLFYTAAAPS